MRVHSGSRALRPAGFTLVELLVVVAVLATLALGAVRYIGGDVIADARADVSRTSLVTLRAAILGEPERPGFRDDLGELPLKLSDLFVQPLVLPSGALVQAFDPLSGRGWNGPYLSQPPGRYHVDDSSGFSAWFGAEGEPAALDAWGRAIVLQAPTSATTPAERDEFTRLVSAGPDGIVTTDPSQLAPDAQATAEVGDDLVLYLLRGNGP